MKRVKELTIIAALSCCMISWASEQTNTPAELLPAKPARATALPSKPSEDEIELLDSKIRTNQLSSLSKQSIAEKFQTALESARQLREDKDLKRAERAFIQLLEGRAPEEIKRAALLDLGMVMQEQREYTKAQHIYSEYTRRYEKDPKVPEVFLRQAYLYRQMGVSVLALSKLYAVISSCLNLKLDELEYYQKLVLRAQAEIAETYFLDGQYSEAVDYLKRLLRLETEELERGEVLYKLLRCYSAMKSWAESIANARLFLEKYSDDDNVPEVRFMLASALKKLNRDEEALQEISVLLQEQHESSKTDPKQWLYWQQRAGNEIANQLYREGDFVNALQVYELLADLNKAPEWQLPVWYQIGLVFENLRQNDKACEMYDKLISRETEAALKAPTPALKQVAEMAAWRKQYLQWQLKAEISNQRIREARANSVNADSL